MKRFGAAVLLPRLEQMSNRHFIKISHIKNKRADKIFTISVKWSIYYGHWTQTGALIPQSFTNNPNYQICGANFQIEFWRLLLLIHTKSNQRWLQDQTTYLSRVLRRCSFSSPFSWTIISSATVTTAVNLDNLHHQTWWQGKNIITTTPTPKNTFCNQDSRLQEASINNYI